MDDPVGSDRTAASEHAHGRAAKLERCGEVASASEHCRSEIWSPPLNISSRAAVEDLQTGPQIAPVSGAEAKIELVDIPVPGTGDERLQVRTPVVISENPYIAGQETPYKPDEPVHPTPWGRPGETVPSKIEHPNEFAKSLLEATMQAAARIHTIDDCGRGPREGLDDLKLGFNIADDMTIDGQKYRWRSAIQLGEYLSKSGLFDVIPLDKMQNKLEDGFIVVRPWNDQLIRSRGENKGDIAVVSHLGYQYNDHREPYQPYESRYNGGYVLVPKGYIYRNQPMQFISLIQQGHIGRSVTHFGHGINHGHTYAYGYAANHGHTYASGHGVNHGQTYASGYGNRHKHH